MLLQSMSHLKKYNHLNEPKIYLMNCERLDFHKVCVFPYNILTLIKEVEGTEKSHVGRPRGGSRQTLLPGRYYFIPAGMPTDYDLKPGTTFYTFHVGMEIHPGIDLFSRVRHIAEGDATNMLAELSGIYAERSEFLALCRTRRLLLDFFIAHWPDAQPVGRSLPEDVRSIMERAKTQADASLSVKELAAELKITPEAFSRKFKALVRISPKEFITKCVLEKTIAQLCESNASMKEIAEKLKFSSEFYMSRFFKKHTSLSPSSYRREFKCSRQEHEIE